MIGTPWAFPKGDGRTALLQIAALGGGSWAVVALLFLGNIITGNVLWLYAVPGIAFGAGSATVNYLACYRTERGMERDAELFRARLRSLQ